LPPIGQQQRSLSIERIGSSDAFGSKAGSIDHGPASIAFPNSIHGLVQVDLVPIFYIGTTSFGLQPLNIGK
jgi:hypothetical protein